MKKLSLLLGTLGGGLAGYLFSNKTLRDQLAKAKDPEAAARLLGVHLQKDGKKLAAEIQKFIESEEVQKNVDKAKKYAKKTVDDARKELEEVAGMMASRAKQSAKKTVQNGKKKAKQVQRKMQTKVRKLS